MTARAIPGDALVVILCWAVLLIAGVAAAVWLARGALASWREQRAGLVYELTPRYRGTAVRGGAAVAVAGCVLAGGVGAALTPDPVGGSVVRVAGVAGPVAAAGEPTRPAAVGVRSAGSGRAAPSASAAPPRASSAKASPSSPALVAAGHAAGGQLLRGGFPGVPGQFLVWLPAQYPGRTAPLQVVVVRTDAAKLGDVVNGLASAVDSGRSNPFVAVVPLVPCPAAGAAVAAPARQQQALRRAVAARFHVVAQAGGWGLIGLGAGAPCAVATELAAPTSYVAAAGLSGRYDALLHLPAPGVSTAARVLLAAPARDTPGQRSAVRLRDSLAPVPRTEARLTFAVRDFTAQLERVRLVRQAADYLTEQMAAPSAARMSGH